MASHSESKLFLGVDLLVVGSLGAVTLAFAAGSVGSFPGREPLGAVALLFAPGYALVCSLFPYRHSQLAFIEGIRATVGDDPGRITVVERLFLAIGMSLCLVPLLGLGLIFAGIEIQQSTILGAVGFTTVGLTVVAVVRRYQANPHDRFDPRVTEPVRNSISGLTDLDRQASVSILLVLGFVVAGAGIGVAVLEGERGEQFTEFGLVTEDPESGELTADSYPDELTDAQSDRIQTTITNNEGRPVEYTVVTLVESLDSEGQRQRAERVDSFSVSVQNGETVREQRSIDPDISGDNLRLTYLLYIDAPPEEQTPEPDTAYRTVHIWVDIPDDN